MRDVHERSWRVGAHRLSRAVERHGRLSRFRSTSISSRDDHEHDSSAKRDGLGSPSYIGRQAFLAKPAHMLIGGQWREAVSGERLESIDPATGKAIGSFPAGDKADANEAVSAARRAFNGAWRKISPYERGRLLQKAASLIEKYGEELAQLITLENGKPLWEAKKEVATAVSWTDYYAGWTTRSE